MPSIPSTPILWRRAGWLLGLPVLAAIWAGTGDLAARRISESLTAAAGPIARETAGSLPEPWLLVDTRGRDLVARGEAPDATTRDQALARLAVISGLRRLIDRTGLIGPASPFVWRIARTGPDRVEASGDRPAEIGATALAERLASEIRQGTRLRDRARAARGAPPDFASAALFAAERLDDLTTGSVAMVSDTVLSVRGEAVSAAAYERLRAALAAPPEGFSVGAVEVLPPAIADYTLSILRRPDGGVVLSGFAESETARAALHAAAAGLAEGAPVQDGLGTARGLPGGIDTGALARFALRVAELMREGGASFEGGRLSVSGTALDAQAVGEIEALMRDGRPPGIAAGPVALGAQPVSPYRVRIRRDADSVTLTGHLPDAATREAWLAHLRTRFFQAAVHDRTRLSAGAPADLAEALRALVDPLATLAAGEAVLSERTVSLSGRSLYEQAAARVASTLPDRLPPGWTASVAITAEGAPERLDGPTCERRLAQRIAGAPLRFAPGSSALRAEFYPVLDAVAALARTCPGERVEVIGHLDPPGAAPAAKPAPETEPVPDKPVATKDGPKVRDKSKDKAKARAAKPEAKSTSESKPAAEAPEPEPDLPRQRALAIVDYLQKAGVAPERALASPAPPKSAGDGVGLALRS